MLSAVSSLAKFVDNSNCTFISAARIFHFNSLRDCNRKLIFVVRPAVKNVLVYIATPSRPILTGSNCGLLFGPFNTNYRDMDSDMERSGIISEPNCWQLPYAIDQDKASWSLVSPRDFFYFVIPFEIRCRNYLFFHKIHTILLAVILIWPSFTFLFQLNIKRQLKTKYAA